MNKTVCRTILGLAIGCFVMPTSPPAKAFVKVADTVPGLPACLATDAAIRAWCEKALVDEPPPGGTATCMRFMAPKYIKSDKIGEIYGVIALMQFTSGPEAEHPGVTQYVLCGFAYHLDSGQTTLDMAKAVIDPDSLIKNEKFWNPNNAIEL